MDASLEEQITLSRILLQDPYAYLNGEGGYEALPNQSELRSRITKSRLLLEDPYAYSDGQDGFDAVDYLGGKDSTSNAIELEELRAPRLVGKRVTFEEIEEISKRLQIAIWMNRKAIWGNHVSKQPIEILNPSEIFGLIGYNFKVDDDLGEFSTDEGPVPVAGFINESKRYAGISSRIPLNVSQFTAAHELGHAVLHPANGLHRDRALDGSPVAGPRERIEVEADKFAAYFLMPAKLLAKEFRWRFGLPPFAMNEDTSFWLIGKSSSSLRNRFQSLRELSRTLAAAEQFGGKHFDSLTKLFKVSKEAMAIRLEEVGLLKF